MFRERFFTLGIALIASIMLNACNRTEAVAVMDAPPNKAPSVSAGTKGADATIRFLEERVKRDPEDFIAYNKLSGEYLQRVRETGDIAYLDLASKAANASLAVLPAEQNKGGLIALAQVEYSSHDFAAARDHAQQLTKLDPGKGFYFQMLGDSLLELGQYDDGAAAFKQMESLGGLQGLTRAAMEQRLARLALLHGDNKGAASHFAAALKLAQALPEPPRETVAWCQWQLGETAYVEGQYAAAEKYYRDSLATFPDYFRSLPSLGRVRAAQGDLPGAIEQYEKVVKILPDPNFVASLGDLYAAAGHVNDAKTQYELVEQIGHLSTLSGTLYNRQLALFYADHDMNSDTAYQNASKEYEVRRDIYGADAVAWTALKAGKIPDAQAAIKDALKLGTKDARLYYHAGMIEKAAGNNAEAKRLLQLALKTSPSFDLLQSAVARTALEALK